MKTPLLLSALRRVLLGLAVMMVGCGPDPEESPRTAPARHLAVCGSDTTVVVADYVDNNDDAQKPTLLWVSVGKSYRRVVGKFPATCRVWRVP